jgi:DNA-directed RNA polymerase specialized sigma24 family protein
MKTKPKTSPAPRNPEPASPGDIERALKALTLEDSERIRQYATNRIQRIGRAANGRSEKDLMQEALIRLVDGRRHWNKVSITFTQCFIGVIRSIASEWAGHRERNKELPEYAQLEADLTKTDQEGKNTSPFDSLSETGLNAEQGLIRAEVSAECEAQNKTLVKEIEAAFANDDEASILILGFQDGMDGPTIRAEFDISEQQFKTTMRRIRYGTNKIMERRNGR